MHTYARGYKYITRYLKETILLVDNSYKMGLVTRNGGAFIQL